MIADTIIPTLKVIGALSTVLGMYVAYVLWSERNRESGKTTLEMWREADRARYEEASKEIAKEIDDFGKKPKAKTKPRVKTKRPRVPRRPNVDSKGVLHIRILDS